MILGSVPHPATSSLGKVSCHLLTTWHFCKSWQGSWVRVTKCQWGMQSGALDLCSWTLPPCQFRKAIYWTEVWMGYGEQISLLNLWPFLGITVGASSHAISGCWAATMWNYFFRIPAGCGWNSSQSGSRQAGRWISFHGRVMGVFLEKGASLLGMWE